MTLFLILKLLSELNSLRFFSNDVKYKNIERKIKRAYRYINLFKEFNNDIELKEWIIYLMIIFDEIKNNNEYERIINLFRFQKEEEKAIRDIKKIDFSVNWKDFSDSDIYFFWKKFSIEVLIYSLATNENNRLLLKSIFKYWFKLRNIKIFINGDFFKNQWFK
ncbi:MAG: hypothetical protein KatS3mg068_0361 [Candidatus Sericytochromatia bacterium]|nr:MAG: hypothetical protein KatS3mg068_0361 [Candidatus Sericytochromatia bacterium]